MRTAHGLTSALCALMVLFGSISLFCSKLLLNPVYSPDASGVLGQAELLCWNQ